MGFAGNSNFSNSHVFPSILSVVNDNLRLPEPFQKILPMDRLDVLLPGGNLVQAHQEEIREYAFFGKCFESYSPWWFINSRSLPGGTIATRSERRLCRSR